MDGSHEEPREHDAVFPARRSDPRKTNKLPLILDRRKTTIAPDLVTGHLNSVREASPCRLNLRDATSIAKRGPSSGAAADRAALPALASKNSVNLKLAFELNSLREAVQGFPASFGLQSFNSGSYSGNRSSTLDARRPSLRLS